MVREIENNQEDQGKVKDFSKFSGN